MNTFAKLEVIIIFSLFINVIMDQGKKALARSLVEQVSCICATLVF